MYFCRSRLSPAGLAENLKKSQPNPIRLNSGRGSTHRPIHGQVCDVQEDGKSGAGAAAAARRQQHPGDHRSARVNAGPVRTLVVRVVRAHRLPGTSLLAAVLLLKLRCAYQ